MHAACIGLGGHAGVSGHDLEQRVIGVLYLVEKA